MHAQSESQQAIRVSEEDGGRENGAATPTEEDAAAAAGDARRRCGSCCSAAATTPGGNTGDSGVKSTLCQLGLYCCFLMLLTIVAFGMRKLAMYNFTQSINSLFLDARIGNSTDQFRDINTIQDWWNYANGPLLDGLFYSVYDPDANGTGAGTSAATNLIYYDSIVLGVAQIRQLRVTNHSCSVARQFQGVIHGCYGAYGPYAADKGAFGLANDTAWTYQSASDLDGSDSYVSDIATYDGGGYRALLHRNRSASEQTLRQLHRHLWLDRGTRAVFIEFTVYNPNVNLFCVVRLIAEMPPTGGVVPAWNIHSVKLLRYADPWDYFIAACECVLLLMCCYYTVQEAAEIYRQRWAYLRGVSNWLDISLVIVCFVCAGFNIYRLAAVDQKLHSLLRDTSAYPNFISLAYWESRFSNAIAVAVFLAWIKLFKYLRFSRAFTMLSSTLGACAKDLLAFCVIFFIVFSAFAVLGNLVFGSVVDDFQDFQQSVFTLFRIILGDLNFTKLQQAHRVIGPIYFMLYVFFAFFVLLNMFLAIINGSFGEVKAGRRGNHVQHRTDVAGFLRTRAGKLLEKLSAKRKRLVSIQQAILSVELSEDSVNFEDWRSQLKRRGFADAEIEALFAKYDADGDQVLCAIEWLQMQRDLECERFRLEREIAQESAHGGSALVGSADTPAVLQEAEEAAAAQGAGFGGWASSDDLDFLTRRVDRLEGRVSDALDKIDRMLTTLERLEKLRLQRRAGLSRLLMRQKAGSSAQLEHLIREELMRWEPN